MTFNKARTSRRVYLMSSFSAFAAGFVILLVTAMKQIYIFISGQDVFGGDVLRTTIGWIYREAIFVPWLWPWMSGTGFDGATVLPLSLLSPTGFVGFALLTVGAFLSDHARRLRRWMVEVKGLIAKQDMISSLRPSSSKQSTADVRAGRDANISQQITNHYNNPPDSRKVPIIVALITVLGAIAAAFLRRS